MDATKEKVDEVYRTQSRQIFATLVRLVGDVDLAEEAMHEAFAAAMTQWAGGEIPSNATAWLISTGRFKAVDIIRRSSRLAEMQPEIAARLTSISETNDARASQEISDDLLRLIFTCCHPAIDPKIQIPLTLREVCGMTTEEIASAFLVKPSTMAARIVRGKAKIRDAEIPYVIPSLTDMPERLDAVLACIYLVFNEGYSASTGVSLTRSDLSDEAIRLARLLLDLLPEPEVMGLLSLMLLHESRRKARQTRDGDIVLLDDQDRTLWNRDLIAEGKRLIEQAFRSRRVGVYTIQAAISAVHADAATPADTDWAQIVALYDVLVKADPSPVIELNRGVAIAMRDGAEAGLAIIDAILGRGELTQYNLAHSARGELLRRIGRETEAIAAFEQALALTQQDAQRRFLQQKLQLPSPQ
ncbi:RNA polymerase sigma factor [Novipirellula sp. SH528]|uniref:RNA polymerase sigma factor n=1 Tax=Novipirellula sp. SH528 TaxID=3454466 RepID=UPI003F9F3ACE